MSVVLPILLYLGLSLGQNAQAQKGYFSRPVLTALPGAVVLSKTPVTILCEGPPEAEAYKIYKKGEHEPWGTRKSLKAGNTLNITEMKPGLAGQYHCSYKSGKHWSQLSEPLHLVMTGAYVKPSLLSMSGTVVGSGDNVKLQCFSRVWCDAFILMKEVALFIIQNQSSTTQDNGCQAIFHIHHVTSTKAETYRCYVVSHYNRYVWSHPSDPLQLVAQETPDYPDSTEPRSPHAPSGWSFSTENQVRLSVAGLLLLVLVILVAEAWYSQKRSLHGR